MGTLAVIYILQQPSAPSAQIPVGTLSLASDSPCAVINHCLESWMIILWPPNPALGSPNTGELFLHVLAQCSVSAKAKTTLEHSLIWVLSHQSWVLCQKKSCCGKGWVVIAWSSFKVKLPAEIKQEDATISAYIYSEKHNQGRRGVSGVWSQSTEPEHTECEFSKRNFKGKMRR